MRAAQKTVFRLLCLLVILFAGFTDATAASAIQGDSCVICLNSNSCPWDLSIYDSQCNSLCGGGTYAGACSSVSSCAPFPESPADAGVLCYWIE